MYAVLCIQGTFYKKNQECSSVHVHDLRETERGIFLSMHVANTFHLRQYASFPLLLPPSDQTLVLKVQNICRVERKNKQCVACNP